MSGGLCIQLAAGKPLATLTHVWQLQKKLPVPRSRLAAATAVVLGNTVAPKLGRPSLGQCHCQAGCPDAARGEARSALL